MELPLALLGAMAFGFGVGMWADNWINGSQLRQYKKLTKEYEELVRKQKATIQECAALVAEPKSKSTVRVN